MTISRTDLIALLTTAGVDSSVIIIRSDPLTILSTGWIEDRLSLMAAKFCRSAGITVDATQGPWAIERGIAWLAARFGIQNPEGPYAIGHAIISTGGIDTYFLVACVFMSGTNVLAFYAVTTSVDGVGGLTVDITYTTALIPADATQVVFQ